MNIKEKFVITFISQFFIYIAQLSISILLFSNLGAVVLGTWTFLISVVNIGFLFVNIGFDVIYLQNSGNKNNKNRFSTFFIINIIIIMINLIITLIIITILNLWSTNYSAIIFFLIFSKIFSQIGNIFLINLRSRIKVFKGEIPYFFTNLGKIISVFYLLLNSSYFYDPLFYISFFYFIFDLILMLLLIIFSRNEIQFKRIDKGIAINYLKDIKPIAIFSIIYVIATNLGELIIKYSLGLESLGYYSLINRYIITTLISISGFFIPLSIALYSQYFEKKDYSSIKQITHITEKYYSIIILSIIILIYLNGFLVLSIFLPHYINSIQILLIMTIIPYIIAITRPYSLTLISGKKTKIKYNISTINYLLITIMMLVFIPQKLGFFPTLGMGLVGCAISQTIPWFLWMVLNYYFTKKYFDLAPQKRTILHVILAILSVIISIILKDFILSKLFQDSVLLLILSSLVALGIFYFFLYIFKEIRRSDFIFFIQLFNFNSYLVSLREEFSEESKINNQN